MYRVSVKSDVERAILCGKLPSSINENMQALLQFFQTEPCFQIVLVPLVIQTSFQFFAKRGHCFNEQTAAFFATLVVKEGAAIGM